MTFAPAALRAIADELEAELVAAQMRAFEKIGALVLGGPASPFPIDQATAEAADREAAGESGIDPGEVPTSAAPWIDGAEAPPVATPEAVVPPLPASATVDRRPLVPAGTNPFTAPTRPCPKCGMALKHQGFGPHLAKKHGIRGEALARLTKTDGLLRAHDAPKTKTFLCPRCNEGFLSREARDAHEAGHAPVPDPQVGLTGRRVGGPPSQ
jgi:hypothetical protein